MPLTRSASALVDQHIHPPHERSRNRKRSIEAHTPGPSKTTNYGAAPSTATISTTTLEPQINSQVSESHSLQVFAAHRQSSLYDEAIDANLFETLKKGLEDELEKAKGAGTGKRGSVGEDNGNRWVMAPTTWYLDDPQRPQHGLLYTYSSKPPLSSTIRSWDLPRQSEAEKVPVGHQLPTWKPSTPIPHLSCSQSHSSQSLPIPRQLHPLSGHPTNRLLNRGNERSFVLESFHPDKSIQEMWDQDNGRSGLDSQQEIGEDGGEGNGSTMSDSFILGVQSHPYATLNGRGSLKRGEGGENDNAEWLDKGMDEVGDWDWQERDRFSRGDIMQKITCPSTSDGLGYPVGGVQAEDLMASHRLPRTATWSEGITSVIYPSATQSAQTLIGPSSPQHDSRGRTLAPVPRPPTSFVLPPLTQPLPVPITTTITTTTVVGAVKRKPNRLKPFLKKTTTTRAHAGVGGAARLAELRKLGKMKTSLSPFKLPGSRSTGRASSAPPPTPPPPSWSGSKERVDGMEGDDDTQMEEMSEPELQDEEMGTLEDALSNGAVGFGTAVLHSTLHSQRMTETDVVKGGGHENTPMGEELPEEDVDVVVEEPLPIQDHTKDPAVDQPRATPTDAMGLRRREARNRLSENSIYSSILDIFPERHLPNPQISTDLRTLSEQSSILKTYSASPPPISSPNPFHPHWKELQDHHPHMRVCWIIPIQGDVYVDGLSEEDQPSSAEVFQPSVSSTSDKSASVEFDFILAQRRESRRLLIWTHPDLLSLYAFLLKQRNLQRYGPLSIRICTSSPDPFRARPALLPDRHRHSPPTANETNHQGGNPVRPEIGTHLRIYMDLRWASRFRYLLSGFQSTIKLQPVPPVSFSSPGFTDEHPGDGVGNAAGDRLDRTRASTDKRSEKKSDTGIHLMYKKRLVLLGEMGEVLVMI